VDTAIDKPSHSGWLASKPTSPNADLAVLDKYSGEVCARVPLFGKAELERAAAASATARESMARLPAYVRREILDHCADRIEERSTELALQICTEAGKPIRDARSEIARAIQTFRVAAEEAVRIGGEVLEMERAPHLVGYSGLWKRFPLGACGFITPFNFPLNLVAHKVSPAIAAGCPFVLKPASYTPLSALSLGEILAETDLPEGAFSILPARGETAGVLVDHPELALISFTGSAEVGWGIRARAGRKRVVLELGGNAGCIVDETADLSFAAERIAFGGYYQAGQSCISVQRVIVSSRVYEPFLEELLNRVRDLPVGDPKDPETVVGPLISEADAQRVVEWIERAEGAGAKRLCGGERSGSVVTPAIVENVPRDQDLYCREVFGPVVVVSRYSSFEEAIAEVNDSEFGLQAGIFTNDIGRATRAFESLEVGGVVIGDIPSFRADHMPYGGVKASGSGREGVRWAIEEMTEIKMLVLRKPTDRHS
jgi:acyl-CoA reductase-like NAD-dependent aldehyde dehydrogenase